ncbi:MAG: protein kinase [Deltaproteobacteria bacterium]|nr:protein kinase [Deltaproteobacteria bacterium]
MSIVDFLAGLPGFRSIDRSELERIASGVDLRTYGPGAHLIRRGDPGENMHVIMEGRVRVPIVDEHDAAKTVFFLGPGEVVGEMALLTGEPRNADVIAEQEVASIVFHRSAIEPLLAEYPGLAGFLTEILGQRLEARDGIQEVGKYRLLGKLGEGSTGKVYEALHPELNRVVAVKMLAHCLVYDSRFRERFLQEARTAASLDHPHIVEIYDTEKAYATYFIVMEKLSGRDLASLLAERGALPPAEAVGILRQVASALAYAHGRGFAHRDVKPANVAFDEGDRVKLMDFGLARPIPEDADGRQVSGVEGTPQYIAPETAMGKLGDGRVDIYALGVMAFQMLTGELPFGDRGIRAMLQAHVRTPPPDIAERRPGLPGPLVELVRGTLVKDPDRRLADWDRILELLEPAGRPVWREARERIVRIRYSPSAAERVERAVGTLLAELGRGDDVETAQGHILPASAGTQRGEEP